MAREIADRVRGAGPEERRKIAGAMAEFLDTSTLLLRESPPLRGAFSRIHSEFLKYPESGDIIRRAISAHKNYVYTERDKGADEVRGEEFPHLNGCPKRVDRPNSELGEV